MAARWLMGSRVLARRLLPLTMGVVVAIFVASTIYTELLLNSDVGALDIASNSAPSIAQMARARGELRAIERAADRAIAPATPAAAASARAVYAERRSSVDTALAAYVRSPFYRGELALYQRVQVALARLDAIVANGAAAPDGERSAGTQRVEQAVDEVDSAMREISELNRHQLQASAATIARIGRRRNRYAFALNGVGILIAFIATVLAIRTVERFIATLDRRARELEYLAIQVGHEIANPLVPIQVVLRTSDEHLDEAQRDALGRARRALARIEESIIRLTAFARAGIPPAAPPPRTPLLPALEAAAHAAGVSATADPTWHVGCAAPMLRELFGDLLGGSVPPGGAPLAGVEVHASGRYVRVSVVRAPDGPGAADPFDPQLHTPGSEHPGIDLRLAAVRRRVEACGGAVGVRRDRRHQRLWIDLPRA